MDWESKHWESLLAVANRKYKLNEVSPDDQLSQSDGGIGNTDGNNRDNISKDEIRGPDNSSPRVTSLREKIKNDLSHFKSTLAWWRQKADDLESEVRSMMMLAPHDTLEDKLRDVELEISSLKLNLAAPHNLSKAKSSTPGLSKVGVDAKSNQMLEKLQDGFEKMSASPTIQGVQQLYNRLDEEYKNCLLCLTAFPENAIIKKRVLINWWVGEGLLVVTDPKGSMAVEKAAEKIFKELGEKGFIMLVHKKGKRRSPVPDSCQLHPFMRRVLITLAKKAKFFDLDLQGNATPDYSQCTRACLVEGGQLSRPSTVSEGRKLKTLFNMNEQFLDLKLDFFISCKVLQLGRWMVSADHNIDVDDAPSLLRGMGTMKRLRYLSLQGVTKIGKLPASICDLYNLTILDLGACQSLETLPREIGSLKKLTYLDFSECYMISRMPKSLKNLQQLQVLKGFVLYQDGKKKDKSENREEACTLSDLASMKKLWKLSLRLDKADDLEDEHIKDLSQLPELTSLMITWIQATKQPSSSDRGAGRKSKRRKESSKEPKKPENSLSGGEPFPGKLTKLDLRGYPRPSMPKWLTHSEVKVLEKLYIRGGNLANLNRDSHSDSLWSVKILRLKFLANCEIEWLDLRHHFPSLVYLEKFHCPKLKLFPCDGYGIWMNPNAKEEG
ncbi:disease resistance RPP13-like protein 4 [Syzygium oleosum]|uniref:disease resistance RPP13-like protein 4 n=1 Tax=Syzygium oleosum TaxID=219896 RepID=UPI0011D1D8EB|nr:disease resistance RPP13-like protein 4 [Syzygium oleosum]